MTIYQQVQATLYAMADTVNLWRDLAIAGLAVLVVVLLYAAASSAE